MRACVVASSTMLVFVHARAPPGASPAPRRCTGARWRAARPAATSKVRSIRWSRACVSTWIVTSSGMRSSSISLRTKSNSICEAEGKPTSISLKPIATSISNMRILRAMSIGSISAWLPSRRSRRQPDRRLGQHGVGPGAVLQADRVRRRGTCGWVASTSGISRCGWDQPATPKQNGPLLVRTGRGEGFARALPSPPVGDQ